MKDNSINETFTFELTRNKIKDLDLNVSSSVSYDFSYSFEKQNTEFFSKSYSKDKIENKRSERKKLPKELK